MICSRGTGGNGNGSYERQLTTRVGTIAHEVPRDREGTFQTAFLQRDQRSEKAIVLMLMQLVVQGVPPPFERPRMFPVRVGKVLLS